MPLSPIDRDICDLTSMITDIYSGTHPVKIIMHLTQNKNSATVIVWIGEPTTQAGI